MMYLVVFATLTVLIASSSCDSDCEGEQALKYINTDECLYYFDLLETALLNDSDNVYRLQQTFFSPRGDSTREVDFTVNITVGEIVNGSCDDYHYEYNCWQQPSFSEAGSGEFRLEWKNPYPHVQVEDMLSNTLTIIMMFESVFSYFSDDFFNYPGGLDGDFMYNYDSYYTDCDIELHLDQLPCNPCRDTTYDTLDRIITWAKAYARARGRPKKLDEKDRGDIVGVDLSYFQHEHLLGWKFTYYLLLAGFVFLNVLVMLLMVRFVPGYYHSFVSRVNGDVNNRHTSLSFYWGCALVFFFLAMALYLMDLELYGVYIGVYIVGYIFSGISMVSIITCISVKFVVMVVELVVCVFVCKRNTITAHIPFQRCTTNVLFCCFCCCCCSSTLKSKVVQTLALWGIMAFVQHITASLIPLCFFIILQPAEVFSVLALIASTLFCIIMFVAHLLHLRQVAGHLQRTAFCIQMFAIISFIGLAIVSIVVFLQFLIAGVEFDGLGGFLGSLVPSIILSAVGWYIKKRFLDTKTSADPQPTAPNLTTEPDRLETVVVHRNAPVWNSDSDGEQTPLLRHMN